MFNKRPLIFLLLIFVYLIVVLYIVFKRDPYTIDDAIEAHLVLESRDITKELIQSIEEIEVTCKNKTLSLEEVGKLKNLKKLTINTCYINEFKYLSNLDHLEVLTINQSTFKLVSDNKIKSVKHLQIKESNIKDFKSINQFENLNKLSLLNNYNAQNINKVERFPHINELEFSYNEGINLNVLTKFENLELLEIRKIPGWKDYWGPKYYRVDDLELNHDVSVINKLTTLKELKLINLELTNLDLVNQLSQLERLTIEETREQMTLDMSQITLLTNLTTLQINDTSLLNSESIRSLKRLENLEVSESNLQDITFISQLTYLKTLNLSYNSIEDLTPLLSLEHLVYLNIKDNPINQTDERQKSTIEELRLKLELIL